MVDNATYDDELDSFVFDSNYKFKSLEKKIRAHFKDGGLNLDAVLGGVCGVSYATIYRWRDKNSQFYKPEFVALVKQCETDSVEITDKWHRESASGRRPKANAHTLNRRAEKLLNLNSTIKTEQVITHKYNNVEDIDAEIEKLQEEQENV